MEGQRVNTGPRPLVGVANPNDRTLAEDGLGPRALPASREGPGESPGGRSGSGSGLCARSLGLTGPGSGARAHLAGRVMMRVEKSKRSRLILRRFLTSSSSSATRIRSWSWPPSTLWGRGGGMLRAGGGLRHPTGRQRGEAGTEGHRPHGPWRRVGRGHIPSNPGPGPLPPFPPDKPPSWAPPSPPPFWGLSPPTFSNVLHITPCSCSTRSR